MSSVTKETAMLHNKTNYILTFLRLINLLSIDTATAPEKGIVN